MRGLDTAVLSHQAALDRAIDQQARTPLRTLWDARTSRMLADFVSVSRRSRGNFAALQQALSAALRSHLLDLGTELGAELRRASSDTMTDALYSLGALLRAVAPSVPTYIDDPAYVRAIVGEHRGRVEEQRAQSIASAVAAVDASLQELLARKVAALSTAQPEEGGAQDLVTDLHDALEGQWWRVERVANTETAHAFNLAQAVALAALSRAVPGLMQRWTEKIDLDGNPLDDKVADDSMELHAQLAPLGGKFIMPPNTRVWEGMIGKTWYHPPNRPNDRAVLTPWAPGWGIPGWVWTGRTRRWLTPPRGRRKRHELLGDVEPED
jgi:hypothetical protein